MDDVPEMFAKIGDMFGIERAEEVDDADAMLGANLAGHGVALDDVVEGEPLVFDAVRDVAEEFKAGLVIGPNQTVGQVAIGDAGVERRRHRQDDRVRGGLKEGRHLCAKSIIAVAQQLDGIVTFRILVPAQVVSARNQSRVFETSYLAVSRDGCLT